MDSRLHVSFGSNFHQRVVARTLLGFLVCVLAIGSSARVASANPTIEIDELWRSFGFTSPSNAYGPWNAQEIRARADVGRNSPGFDLTNQSDADRLAPQHGQYAVVDDYYRFRPGLFAYASLGAGSGNILPLHSAYGEVDVQVLHSTPLLMGVGGAVLSTADRNTQRYLSFGPTLYFKGGTATARYIPSSSSNNVTGTSGAFTLQLGSELTHTTVLNVQFGNSPPFLQQAGNALVLSTGERAVDANLTFKRRLHHNLGITYGLEYTHIVTAATNGPVYVRRGALLGLTWFGAH